MHSARLFAAPHTAVVDVGLSFLSPKTWLLNHTNKQANDPSTTPASDLAQDACFDLHERVVISAGHLLWNVFENRKIVFFFSGRKTRPTQFGRQPYYDPNFSDYFRTVVLTNTQQRDGSTMRYAKALRRDFRFLPGLYGARRTGVSQPMQKQHGTRDEGITTPTLHARRVVFRCRLCLPLAESISFINSYLPDGDYPPRPRRSKNCGCARRNCSRSRHKNTATTPNGSW